MKRLEDARYSREEIIAMSNQQLADELNFLPFYDDDLISELFIRAFGCDIWTDSYYEKVDYIQEAAEKLNLTII